MEMGWIDVQAGGMLGTEERWREVNPGETNGSTEHTGTVAWVTSNWCSLESMTGDIPERSNGFTITSEVREGNKEVSPSEMSPIPQSSRSSEESEVSAVKVER
jgi:hypothetical protein